jgi:hypothetical protein
MQLNLTAERCNLAYWLTAVAQGTLRSRAIRGHAPDADTPDFMRVPGPLREALVLELACRSVAEEKATRTLTHFVTHAPSVPEMEFYATQLIDEARHARVFRDHLVTLGVPADRLLGTIDEIAADYTREILDPVVEFTLATVRDEADFLGGVAIFTIIIEGVLAPAAELSERKWDPFDPAASEIARGAAIDEIRHLSVGSSIIRDHLRRRPEHRPRLLEILRDGRRLWDDLPDRRYVIRREELFQEGMRQHADLVGDYEVWPGRRLLDTTADERYDTVDSWTEKMAEVRLRYMGLEDALPLLTGTPQP